MPEVRTPTLNVHYRRAGKGSNALVFVHGNYASSRWWLPQLERLPPGWQGFAPDLRGCGGSDGITREHQLAREPITIRLLADDLEQFLQALQIDNPILVGHSLGGAVVVEYTLQHPRSVRGLVLEASAPPEGVPAGLTAQILLLPLEIGSASMMRQVLRQAGLPRSGALAKALVADALAAKPGQYLAFTRAISLWRAGDRLDGLDVPTLLVWGQKDRLMPPGIGQIYLERISNAELVLLPQTGHSAHIEHADEFAALLSSFAGQNKTASNYPSSPADMPWVDRLLDRLISLMRSIPPSSRD